MLKSSIPIGRLFGVSIRLHFSWFIIFALVTWALAAGYFPSIYPNWSVATSVIAGIITSLLFFASVLAHELMHSVVAQASGIPVKSITLFIFGGVSQITSEPQQPKVEFRVAVAGPLTSILLGGVFWVIWFALPARYEEVTAVAFWLGWINLLLAGFNLLPGFPLDGGRVFRSILWWRSRNLRWATKWASNTGRGLGFLFIFAGVALIFLGPGYWFNGLWLAFIGWFLGNAAVGSYRQLVVQQMLQGHAASEIMTRDCVSVGPDTTVAKLVSEHILPSGNRCLVVTEDSQLEGLIALPDVKKLPQEQWSDRKVSEIMVPYDKLERVSPDEDLATVMNTLTQYDINQVPVVEGNKIVGMIDRDNLLSFINVRDKLGM